MALSVRVSRSNSLHTVRQVLREIGDKGLGKELGQGLRKAGQPLAPQVRKEARTLPSGYAPTLSKAMKFRTTVRETRHTAWVTYRVHADGRKERRDVPSINRGILRHPLFGNRQFWVDQKVRRGFVDRPVQLLAPAVSREMQKVVDKVADKIRRG